MDGSRFDTLTQTLNTAGSRRRALGGLLLAALGLRGGSSVDDAAAHNAFTACKKKSGKQKKKCLKKAKAHNAQHAAETPPALPACPAERACGSACCPAGDLCVDPFTGLCASGAGTCPPGANYCGQPADPRTCSKEPGGGHETDCAFFTTLRGFSFCGESISFNCAPSCTSDVECVAALDNVGARCVHGPGCCAGGTHCRRPCWV